MAFVFGNNNSNKLAGTSLADLMFGLAGDDTLDAAGGNDVILAGAGNDIVLAGDGNDTADGGSGNDAVDGGAGNDLLLGGAGLDTVAGGADNDTLIGGAGADVLDGGDGNDTATYLTSGAAVKVDLSAGTGLGGEAEGDKLSGIENVVGSFFNDLLTGSAGANSLSGGVGNDTIAGGSGADSMSGGPGSDAFVFGGLAEAATGTDVITDFRAAAPAAGGDRLDISDLVAEFVGAPAALADLVTQGFLSFTGADANKATAVNYDADGSAAAAGATGTLVVLSGIGFTDQAAALAALTDNIVVT